MNHFMDEFVPADFPTLEEVEVLLALYPRYRHELGYEIIDTDQCDEVSDPGTRYALKMPNNPYTMFPCESLASVYGNIRDMIAYNSEGARAERRAKFGRKKVAPRG